MKLLAHKLTIFAALTCIAALSLMVGGNVRAETTPSAQATAAATQPAMRPPGGVPPGGMGPQATLSVPAIVKDVAYATKSTAQKLDLYVPSGVGPFPLIIFIHGGGFMMGDKSGVPGTAANYYLSKGYAIASLNYRLSSEAIFPAQLLDVKAAVRWLRANAVAYKLNPDRFAAWGQSAGGNLVSLLGTTGDVKDFDAPELGNATVSSRVQAVVDQYGPIDFLNMDTQFAASNTCDASAQNHNLTNSPESMLVGGAIQTKIDLVKSANPTTYITQDDPPFLIQHGDKDCNIPLEQAVNFTAALRAVLGEDKVAFDTLEGASHADPTFDKSPNIEKVVAFLDKALK